jgi:hypothetical protein
MYSTCKDPRPAYADPWHRHDGKSRLLVLLLVITESETLTKVLHEKWNLHNQYKWQTEKQTNFVVNIFWEKLFFAAQTGFLGITREHASILCTVNFKIV